MSFYKVLWTKPRFADDENSSLVKIIKNNRATDKCRVLKFVYITSKHASRKKKHKLEMRHHNLISCIARAILMGTKAFRKQAFSFPLYRKAITLLLCRPLKKNKTFNCAVLFVTRLGRKPASCICTCSASSKWRNRKVQWLYADGRRRVNQPPVLQTSHPSEAQTKRDGCTVRHHGNDFPLLQHGETFH